jgi:hypothetical protein
MRRRAVVLFTCFIVISVILFVVKTPVPASAANLDQGEACRAILTRAMQTLGNNCDKLTRNSACYGNDNVKAELTSNAVKFSSLGDKAPIQTIKSITTLPLDAEHGTWGLSLLKLQANLPDTMPGQNVTFLVYGDTSVQNVSGNMQSFYFSTGLGSLNCKEAPPDGILVRSPNHTEVSFTANGVQITIASTIFLSASPKKTMDVQLVEGHARVTAPAGSQTLNPGERVSVPMGGGSGLEPVGAPSAPVADPANAAIMGMVSASDAFAGADAPINVSIDGCITKIDRGIATIYDYQVVIDPKNPALRKAKVGDCVQLSATVGTAPDGSVVLVPVVIQPVVQPVSPGGGSTDPGGGVDGGGNNPGGGMGDDQGGMGDMGGDRGNAAPGNNGGMGETGGMGGTGH